jgi:hypothetical protein
MTNPLPTLEWLHVCDHAFRDEQGKLCLIGLFDTLASAELPGRLPVFSVAIGLCDGEGQYDVGIQVEAPSGKAVNMKLPPVQLATRESKARAVVRLAGMPFEEFGNYTFRLILNGVPLEWPAHVLAHHEVAQQPGAASAPGGASATMPPPPDFPQN